MKTLPTLGLLVAALECGAQNLVPNPGFELFTTCPVGFSQFNGYVSAWVNPNTSTPDYMNACANPFPAGVPHNGTGWQQAHGGSGYAGFYTLAGTTYREFIQVQLTTPLTAGVTYSLSFYAVLHNKSQTAIDDLGAAVTVLAPTSAGTGMLSGNPQPQVATAFGNVLTDSLNWTLVSGTFTAAGGEKYLTIGHLRSDAQTTYFTVNYGTQGAYYYIDDVSLVANSTLPVELLSFTAQPAGDHIHLAWATATEQDNEGFRVQRSLDGERFDAIGWVEGSGNSIAQHQYGLDDGNAPANATIYYRLEQVDLDGQGTLSPVVATRLGADTDPIGVAGNGLIRVTVERTASISLLVSDLTGRALRNEERVLPEGNTLLDPLAGLALSDGYYWVSVVIPGAARTVLLTARPN